MAIKIYKQGGKNVLDDGTHLVISDFSFYEEGNNITVVDLNKSNNVKDTWNVLFSDIQTESGTQAGSTVGNTIEYLSSISSVSSNIQYGAFGEQITAHKTPIVQIANKYKIDPANLNEVEIFEATGGSADNSGNLFRCQTGTSVGGYGVLRSAETLNYRAGQGVDAMFTASFTTGIALSLQFGGLFNLTDTIAFGYNGADFSVLHSYNGAADERLITVTGTGAGTCTVTLADDAVGIAVTNSTVQTNAREIANGLEADPTLSSKWRFEQVNDKVYAISKSAAAQSGTFSISGGVTATIVQKIVGQAKTDAHVAQASWNITSTPFTGFDPTKLNVYKIGFGYLGVANITFQIYNPNTGKFVPVHRIKWSNAYNETHISKPNLKIGWTAASLGASGTNLTVLGASCAIFLEGDEVLKNNTYGDNNVVGSLGTTLTNLITLKSRLVYGNYYNLGKVFPLTVSVDNEHNKAVIVEIYRTPDVAGTINYQFTDEFNSISVIDKAGTNVTNGTLIDSFIVAANGNVDRDLTVLRTELLPTDTFVVAGKTVSGTSAGDTTVSIAWKEEK